MNENEGNVTVNLAQQPTIGCFAGLLALRKQLIQNPEDGAARFVRFCSENIGFSQAQLFQDVFVLFCLASKRNGFFVEFGATDGIVLSNTYFLESRYQWNGILAEPARRWQQSLKSNRTAAIDNRCVWKESGTLLPFFEATEAEFSTVSDFRARDFNKESRREGIAYEVETVSLNDLLSTHGAPALIDYMSIDTEGSEFLILNSLDFDKYSVGIITVEHNYCDPDRQQILNLLTSKGFVRTLALFSKFDDWYIHRSILHSTSM